MRYNTFELPFTLSQMIKKYQENFFAESNKV